MLPAIPDQTQEMLLYRQRIPDGRTGYAPAPAMAEDVLALDHLDRAMQPKHVFPLSGGICFLFSTPDEREPFEKNVVEGPDQDFNVDAHFRRIDLLQADFYGVLLTP